MRVGDQCVLRRGIHAEMAGVANRWRADAQVDFGGARAAQHGHNARGGSPAHDAVVNQGDALPAQNLGQRVELQVDAKLALRLVRLNERTPGSGS